MPHNADDATPPPRGCNGKIGPGDASGEQPEERLDSASADDSPNTHLNDTTVAEYLREHPDFLVRHPELIETLVPPERRLDGAAGGVVLDLHRFMLERLRGEMRGLRDSHDFLVTTGRSNMSAQARIHEAVLAILSAPTFERLIETVTDDLAILLDIDVATLCVERRAEDIDASEFEGGEIKVRGLHRVDVGTVTRLLGPKRRLLLREEIAGDIDVFGPMAGLVRSDALIRLNISPVTPPALLALGARQVGAFHPQQGSELLEFLARSLEITVRAWLDLPD
ncbi:DUF484 family protein [Limibacillus sp. MBR-115]|jgi:uncharacterized protein YigA (DUF484 family)|uniref:DUF484 family protein n=1 Tax=Limibacillus sp. MBR-115 TaxID=3156465 RepID=UPI003395426E